MGSGREVRNTLRPVWWGFEWVPTPLIYPGGQGYKNPSPILDKES
jgi:hypothetical protein